MVQLDTKTTKDSWEPIIVINTIMHQQQLKFRDLYYRLLMEVLYSIFCKRQKFIIKYFSLYKYE